MGFDFTVIVPLLLSHCDFFFVFGCGVSFLVSSSVLMSMIVQQVVLVILLQGHCSFPWVLMCTLLCVCPPKVEYLSGVETLRGVAQTLGPVKLRCFVVLEIL